MTEPSIAKLIRVLLAAPPPSYQSLFGQVREARKSSNGLVDFLRKLVLILLGTCKCRGVRPLNGCTECICVLTCSGCDDSGVVHDPDPADDGGNRSITYGGLSCRKHSHFPTGRRTGVGLQKPAELLVHMPSFLSVLRIGSRHTGASPKVRVVHQLLSVRLVHRRLCPGVPCLSAELR